MGTLSDKLADSSPPIPWRNPRVWWAVLALGSLCLMLGAAGQRLHDQWRGTSDFRGESHFLRSDMQRSAEDIESARQQAERQLQALSARVAELQARVVRLDALGERLVAMESLDPAEFGLGERPAMGGPELRADADEAALRPDFLRALDQLAEDIERREAQLEVLDKLLLSRRDGREPAFTGKPVRNGWVNSRFGHRVDPFTGRVSLHEGIDFAGRKGTEILSVGSGVVTWAGERFGYGLLVEINHGNGYTTRYGHAESIGVKVGDMVRPGQVIARMGNSGRSTGTHLHFEIRRNGVALNPARILFPPRG